jgi:hypothetical protein
VALAIDALRHGWPIAVDGAFTLLPAETGLRARRKPYMRADADLGGARGTLKLANQREAAVPDAPVLIRAAEPVRPAAGPRGGRSGAGPDPPDERPVRGRPDRRRWTRRVRRWNWRGWRACCRRSSSIRSRRAKRRRCSPRRSGRVEGHRPADHRRARALAGGGGEDAEIVAFRSADDCASMSRW